MAPNENDDAAMMYMTAIPVPQTATAPPSVLAPPPKPMPIAEDTLRQLHAQGYTTGLAQSLSWTILSFPLRIWVVDNSGSMQHADGSRLDSSKGKDDIRVTKCSRWAELKETVDYHVKMAALMNAPTTFKLLNDPGIAAQCPEQGFNVGANSDKTNTFAKFFGMSSSSSESSSFEDVQKATSIMNATRPGGVTPLLRHVMEIRNMLAESGQTTQPGQKVVVVLATDGLPSDDRGVTSDSMRKEFVESLRQLFIGSVPVWLVVRLCTNDPDVVEFYNNLDKNPEINLEVLDDYFGEANEIMRQNPWFNYALCLHRMREMGFHDTLLDRLDERPLLLSEVRDLAVLIFGPGECDGLADPESDLNQFCEDMQRIQSRYPSHWNPRTGKPGPWFCLNILAQREQPSLDSCCIIQ